IKYKYTIPITASGIPIGVKSNIPRDSYPNCSRSPLTTRFVDVPISVQIPPKILAKEIGIKNLLTCISCFRDHLMNIEENAATTGILLTKEDIKVVGKIILKSCFLSLIFFENILSAIKLKAPLFLNAEISM